MKSNPLLVAPALLLEGGDVLLDRRRPFGHPGHVALLPGQTAFAGHHVDHRRAVVHARLDGPALVVDEPAAQVGNQEFRRPGREPPPVHEDHVAPVDVGPAPEDQPLAALAVPVGEELELLHPGGGGRGAGEVVEGGVFGEGREEAVDDPATVGIGVEALAGPAVPHPLLPAPLHGRPAVVPGGRLRRQLMEPTFARILEAAGEPVAELGPFRPARAHRQRCHQVARPGRGITGQRIGGAAEHRPGLTGELEALDLSLVRRLHQRRRRPQVVLVVAGTGFADLGVVAEAGVGVFGLPLRRQRQQVVGADGRAAGRPAGRRLIGVGNQQAVVLPVGDAVAVEVRRVVEPGRGRRRDRRPEPRLDPEAVPTPRSVAVPDAGGARRPGRQRPGQEGRRREEGRLPGPEPHSYPPSRNDVSFQNDVSFRLCQGGSKQLPWPPAPTVAGRRSATPRPASSPRRGTTGPASPTSPVNSASATEPSTGTSRTRTTSPPGSPTGRSDGWRRRCSRRAPRPATPWTNTGPRSSASSTGCSPASTTTPTSCACSTATSLRSIPRCSTAPSTPVPSGSSCTWPTAWPKGSSGPIWTPGSRARPSWPCCSTSSAVPWPRRRNRSCAGAGRQPRWH